MSTLRDQMDDAQIINTVAMVRGLISQLQILSLLHNQEGRAVLKQAAEYLDEYASLLESRPS